MSAESKTPPEEFRFAFSSENFEVEFQGSESFVREQIGVVTGKIREVLGTAGTPVPVPGPGAAAPAGSEGLAPLEAFYRRSRTREGRGALQDSILVFAAYLLDEQKKREFSIEDLNFCFDLLGMERPRSLANTLGILKRTNSWLESGSKRGTYVLTSRGRERLKGLLP